MSKDFHIVVRLLVVMNFATVPLLLRPPTLVVETLGQLHALSVVMVMGRWYALSVVLLPLALAIASFLRQELGFTRRQLWIDAAFVLSWTLFILALAIYLFSHLAPFDALEDSR